MTWFGFAILLRANLEDSRPGYQVFRQIDTKSFLDLPKFSAIHVYDAARLRLAARGQIGTVPEARTIRTASTRGFPGDLERV